MAPESASIFEEVMQRIERPFNAIEGFGAPALKLGDARAQDLQLGLESRQLVLRVP
jgi:hypothetical protein